MITWPCAHFTPGALARPGEKGGISGQSCRQSDETFVSPKGATAGPHELMQDELHQSRQDFRRLRGYDCSEPAGRRAQDAVNVLLEAG
jgi:hypothetical protein